MYEDNRKSTSYRYVDLEKEKEKMIDTPSLRSDSSEEVFKANRVKLYEDLEEKQLKGFKFRGYYDFAFLDKPKHI